MTGTESKQVQRKKKTSHNVYGIADRIFYVITGVLVALVICGLLHLIPVSESGTVTIVLDVLVLVAGVFAGLFKGSSCRQTILPYRRRDAFEFIGLYDLAAAIEHEDGLGKSDVLSRDEEVRYLNEVLETLIFPQRSIKQAICLTGKSGCGKSTILSFFKQQYKDRYEIFDFSGHYTNLQASLAEMLGTDPMKELLIRGRKKKLVFIFDQFERFFFLEEEKKQQVRNLIASLSRENTGMILSMREEYLAEFMKEFDINNMMQEGALGGKEHTGILNHLTSVIREDKKQYYVADEKKFGRTVCWQQNTIKENHQVHMEFVGSLGDRTALDPVGSTVFYCENQNEVRVRSGRTEEHASILLNKCEMLFGTDGKAFYEKHKQEPLIQQQITYHMAEYEKKEKQCSHEELKALFEKEDFELLNQYFDVQLTSTESYFHASRILYLLSQARLHQVVMKRQDLEYGLFERQFSRTGHKEVNRVMEQLEQLQLIRRNIKRSDQEYEIAHDFIAQAFLTYSHSNMDRNVKSALDIYMAEYLDTNKKEYIEAKRSHCAGVEASRFYTVVYLVFAFLALAVDGVVHFGYNPWQEIWQEWNVYGDIFTFVPLLMTEACMLYIYQVYHKVIRFYRGKKELACKAVFTGIMAAAVLATLFYPHGLLLYGVGLAVMGANCAFLLNASYQKASRMEMRNYGLKCSVMGLAFAVLHLILWIFNARFPVYMIFVEMAMMALLVGYAYLAHMTREYLYGRRMDAGSERGE